MRIFGFTIVRRSTYDKLRADLVTEQVKRAELEKSNDRLLVENAQMRVHGQRLYHEVKQHRKKQMKGAIHV